MEKLSEIPTSILVHTHVTGKLDLHHLKTFEASECYSVYL